MFCSTGLMQYMEAKAILNFFRAHLAYTSDCVIRFLTHGLSFRGKKNRSDYFTGFIGIHLLLFLLLPPLLSSTGNLPMLAAIFCMFLTFLVSLSATCRRVHDAGGRWYLPILPLAAYLLFCCCMVLLSEYVTAHFFYVFLTLFGALVAWNMYYLFKPSEAQR